MHRRRMAGCLIGLLGVVASCSDDNTSTLSALGMPGEMLVSAHCLISDRYEVMTETECKAAQGEYSQTLYVANMQTASLAYVPFYERSQEFKVIDTTQSVPGATSISVGERPHSLAGDDKGALVVIASTINNDISFVSQTENREVAWQSADKLPRKIIYRVPEAAYFVFFADGAIRKLTVGYDCGKGAGVLTPDCKLTKESLDIKWQEAGKLGGRLADYADDPAKPNIGYVSYSDRRYVSVIGFDDEAGACADKSSEYPCELRRIGAGFGCSDGIDNDGNGFIDALDPSCYYPWSAEGQSSADDIQVGWYGRGACNDGIDNDGDGLIDALDPGCVSSNDASEEEGFQPMTPGTCGDGYDNDGDGDADRDDIKCRWPTDNEDAEDASADADAEISGICRDAIDNDGDGLTDAADLACYGKNWLSETDMMSAGRGQIDIDPQGRWLYVLDPTDSQLIVIDLATEKTIDRSGWFPRNRVVGIPVSRLALDVAADVRYEEIYKKNSHSVMAERAVAFVSSTSGTVTEYLIYQKLTHYKDGQAIESLGELAMRPSDSDDTESYIGTVRCIGRICSESDLPTVELRQRPAISYFASAQTLSSVDPETGKPNTVPYDAIIQSETWRIEYEGVLEQTERTDGSFDSDGKFRSVMDFCLLGARNGDRLIVKTSPATAIKKNAACSEKFSGKNLEWKLTAAGPHELSVEPTGADGDAADIPTDVCFESGLNYEIRAAGAWLVTSKSTYVNRRFVAGNKCIDDPRQMYGRTRFALPQSDAGADNASFDVNTAIFGVHMPANAVGLKRGDAFEFTTRSGLSNKTVGVGAAPTALALFKASGLNFLLISEASANAIAVYDIDDESLEDTL